MYVQYHHSYLSVVMTNKVVCHWVSVLRAIMLNCCRVLRKVHGDSVLLHWMISTDLKWRLVALVKYQSGSDSVPA